MEHSFGSGTGWVNTMAGERLHCGWLPSWTSAALLAKQSENTCLARKRGVSFVPRLAQPFLTQFPEKDLCAGQSPHCQSHLTMVQSLEEAFREKEDANLEQ